MSQQFMPQQYNNMGFSPMATPQQRLQNMEQTYQQNGYPQVQQQMMPQGYGVQPQQMMQQGQFMPQQAPIIKGRAVTSIDEVRASMIDLDGSLFVFPDMGNKKIHTKQINLDGTATINTYVLEKPVLQTQPEQPTQDTFLETKNYPERSEFEQAVKSLTQQIDDLKKEIGDTKQGRQNGNNQKGGN